MSGRYVYFVQAEQLKLIKVGIATNVWKRVGGLQVGCPDRLIVLGVLRSDDARADERHLHDQLREWHSHGEWFHPIDALLEFIARECEPAPPKPLYRVADKIRAAIAKRRIVKSPASEPVQVSEDERVKLQRSERQRLASIMASRATRESFSRRNGQTNSTARRRGG